MGQTRDPYPAAEVGCSEPPFEDVFCIHCGYNLRGCGMSGRCPECGFPKGDTLGTYAFADPMEIPGMALPRLVSASRISAMWAGLVLLLPLIPRNCPGVFRTGLVGDLLFLAACLGLAAAVIRAGASVFLIAESVVGILNDAYLIWTGAVAALDYLAFVLYGFLSTFPPRGNPEWLLTLAAALHFGLLVPAAWFLARCRRAAGLSLRRLWAGASVLVLAAAVALWILATLWYAFGVDPLSRVGFVAPLLTALPWSWRHKLAAAAAYTTLTGMVCLGIATLGLKAGPAPSFDTEKS